jgi:hypothetical protein
LPHDLKEGQKHIHKKTKTEPHQKGRTTDADLKHGGAEGWLHLVAPPPPPCLHGEKGFWI